MSGWVLILVLNGVSGYPLTAVSVSGFGSEQQCHAFAAKVRAKYGKDHQCIER
jgi:uncharacterized membrane protein